MDSRLAERAHAYGKEYGLTIRQVVELALAQLFAIPPAIEGYELPLALCSQCERGIVAAGRCTVCHWRPIDPRRDPNYNKGETRAARARQAEQARANTGKAGDAK
jgi:hypothetical protein